MKANQPKFQTSSNRPASCLSCEPDDFTSAQLTNVVGALSFCVKTFERVGVMVELVRDLAVDGQDLKRILSLCEEVSMLLNDGQQAIDGAVLE